ncbi:MAG: class I SAM-dependent methyltransferase [Deltaproteobacteria bacterium]|nr:class I SAM-dependent methyltransferase [Deltaproteobacteria bacterium]
MENWFYDEFKHCGVDYSQVREAEKYDDRHQKFRDFEKEFRGMLEFLELGKTEEKTVIDLGCGTGAMTVLAADLFKTVYAVDISPVMLEKAKKKLDENVHNIVFANAGFLTYEHDGEAVDLVMTKVAFHHLPDFWKQVALLRINRMVKMGGLLYIHDIVFQFDPGDYAAKIDAWVEGFEKVAGEKFRADVENHIRNEYSTFGWILTGMLERAGFAVEKYRCEDDFSTEYACRKVKDLNG